MGKEERTFKLKIKLLCVLSNTHVYFLTHSFTLIYLRRIPFSLLLIRLVTILSLELAKESILTRLLGNSVFGAEVKNQFPLCFKKHIFN